MGNRNTHLAHAARIATGGALLYLLWQLYLLLPAMADASYWVAVERAKMVGPGDGAAGGRSSVYLLLFGVIAMPVVALLGWMVVGTIYGVLRALVASLLPGGVALFLPLVLFMLAQQIGHHRAWLGYHSMWGYRLVSETIAEARALDLVKSDTPKRGLARELDGY